MEFVINTVNDNMILLGSLFVVVITGVVLFWWKRSSTSPKYEAVDDEYWNEDSARKGKKLPVKTRPKKAKPEKGKTAAAPNGNVPSVKPNAKASPSVTKLSDVERREKNEVAKQKSTPSAAGGKKLQQKAQLQSAESPSGEWKTIPVSKRKIKGKKDEEIKDVEKISELSSTPVELPVDVVPATAEAQQIISNSSSLKTESSEQKCEEHQKAEIVCCDLKQESVAVGDAATKQEISAAQQVLPPPPPVAAAATTDDDKHLELTAKGASSDITAAAADVTAAAAAAPSSASVETTEVNDVEPASKSAAKKKKKKNKAAKDQQQTSVVMSQSTEGDDALTTSVVDCIELQPTPTESSLEVEVKLEPVAETAVSRVSASGVVAPTVVENDVTSRVVSMDTVTSTPVTEAIPVAKPAVVFDELGDEPLSTVNKKKKKPRRDN